MAELPAPLPDCNCVKNDCKSALLNAAVAVDIADGQQFGAGEPVRGLESVDVGQRLHHRHEIGGGAVAIAIEIAADSSRPTIAKMAHSTKALQTPLALR